MDTKDFEAVVAEIRNAVCGIGARLDQLEARFRDLTTRGRRVSNNPNFDPQADPEGRYI